MTAANRRLVFGGRLRLRRECLDLTQFQMAVRIGVQPATISSWEQGKSYPARHRLVRLAKSLACDRRWLEGVDGAIVPKTHEDQETASP